MTTVMTAASIVAIVFFAAVVQSLAGFGFALMIMPVITLLLGVQTAAPMVALAALTVYVINVARFRQAVNAGEVFRLAIASAFGIPAGIWLLANVDEALVTRFLGLVLVLYGIYTLLRPVAARIPSRLWVYPAGFLAGCLGAAYNTPGPPAVVYGSSQQWPKDEFRASMQVLFLVNAVLVVSSHLVTGNVTSQVLTYYLFAIPAFVLGIFVGSLVDHRVDSSRFRTIVTVMILALGLALLLQPR
jgi:uncharacterized membrane protein YfcA